MLFLDRVRISRNWATAYILVFMVTLRTVVVKGVMFNNKTKAE